MKEPEPVLVAFCCYFCAYAAADLAGSLRMSYPPNVRVVEVPCSGRVEPAMLVKALNDGADGVMIAGCLEGDCHFLRGNIRARRRVERLQRFLQEMGVEPGRVEMFNLSAAMGPRFAEIVTEMTQRLRELGPWKRDAARSKGVGA